MAVHRCVHPSALHRLTVALSDGSCVVMRSAVRRPIPYATKRDPFNHPAWTGNTGVITETESLRAFRERFGEYGFAPKMEVAAKGAPPTAVGDATAPKEM